MQLLYHIVCNIKLVDQDGDDTANRPKCIHTPYKL